MDENNKCQRTDLIQERDCNEQWGVLDDGTLDLDDYRGGDGASEFSNYACENCLKTFDTWKTALAHVTEASND